MRPAGEVRQALMRAACELATPQQRPTLQELAAKACVGSSTAMHTVKNMTRAGELRVSGSRCVAYRNRPVAEYEPAAGWKSGADGAGFVLLGQMMAAWNR